MLSNEIDKFKSRTVAKMLSGLMGSMLPFTEPEQLRDVIIHFHDHLDSYFEEWKNLKRVMNSIEQNPLTKEIRKGMSFQNG